MEYYSSHINKLIEQLSHLPGIGAKSAQRLAFHIMNMPKDQVEQLTASITDARQNVQYCKCCYTLTDQELCPICANPKRDHSTIMVVENTRDLAAYEKTGKFDGVYHVLHGAISPMLGIGPDDIKLKELMKRLQGDVKEVIDELFANGQEFSQYVDPNRKVTMQTPYNPNGSMYAIEGIVSRDGRVLGKMGHSERQGENRFKNVYGEMDQKLFEAGVNYFRGGK